MIEDGKDYYEAGYHDSWYPREIRERMSTQEKYKMHILAKTKRVFANAKRSGIKEIAEQKYLFSEGRTDVFEHRKSKKITRIMHCGFNKY